MSDSPKSQSWRSQRIWSPLPYRRVRFNLTLGL